MAENTITQAAMKDMEGSITTRLGTHETHGKHSEDSLCFLNKQHSRTNFTRSHEKSWFIGSDDS